MLSRSASWRDLPLFLVLTNGRNGFARGGMARHRCATTTAPVSPLCLSVWSFAPDDEQELAANFSQDLEQTILPADDADSTW